MRALNNVRYMTLSEVAVELGVTPERVRQIEESALRKIRALLNSRSIFGSADVLHGDGDLKQ